MNEMTAGKRLKMVRVLSGMARSSFCKKYGISLNSMNAWETDGATFSDKAASTIAAALEKEGIAVTVEWLMTGKGEKPYRKDSGFQRTEKDDEREEIWNEARRLQKMDEGFVIYNVNDDSCLPIYEPGDFVGAIPVRDPSSPNILQKPCLIELDNGTRIIRNIHAITGNECRSTCINTKSLLFGSKETVFRFSTLYSIVWFRKPFK